MIIYSITVRIYTFWAFDLLRISYNCTFSDVISKAHIPIYLITMIYRSDTRSVLEPSASVEKPSVDKNVKPQKDPTSNTLVVDNSLMQAEQATVKTKSNSIIIPNSKELGRQNGIKTIKYNTVSYVPKKEVSQTTIVNSSSSSSSSNNNNDNNTIQPHCNNNNMYRRRYIPKTNNMCDQSESI